MDETRLHGIQKQLIKDLSQVNDSLRHFVDEENIFLSHSFHSVPWLLSIVDVLAQQITRNLEGYVHLHLFGTEKLLSMLFLHISLHKINWRSLWYLHQFGVLLLVIFSISYYGIRKIMLSILEGIDIN